MPRIYTEIRIAHETEESKARYEELLDEAIKTLGYYGRTDWLRSMARDTINASIRFKKPK